MLASLSLSPFAAFGPFGLPELIIIGILLAVPVMVVLLILKLTKKK